MVVLNKMREYKRKREEKESRDVFVPERTSSPSPHISLTSPNTPATVRTLKCQADFLLDEPMFPAFRRRLEIFIKGSLTQANTAILLKDSLGKTYQAQHARASRKLPAWQCTQRRGLLYAGDARAMAKSKEVLEQEKLATKICQEMEKEAKKLEDQRVQKGKEEKEKEDIKKKKEHEEEDKRNKAIAAAIKDEKRKQKEINEQAKQQRKEERLKRAEEKRLKGIADRALKASKQLTKRS